ncbi:MAG: hypothetical protein KTR15_08615 [Phycisphaeraceae bacterium]|nr:hypothetical protein [Phycisphaeraceae bacterium]
MSQQLPNPDHPHQPNSPEEILFNNNLREFTVKIEHICSLEMNGKIPQEEAYRRIRDLWKALKRSKKNLGIGASQDGEGD